MIASSLHRQRKYLFFSIFDRLKKFFLFGELKVVFSTVEDTKSENVENVELSEKKKVEATFIFSKYKLNQNKKVK